MSSTRYLVWQGGPVLDLGPGLALVVAEIDADGYTDREIGLDVGGAVIHRKPSDVHRYGDYGLLDGPPVDVDVAIRGGNAREISQMDFLELWSRPTPAPPPGHAKRSRSPFRRLRR